MPSAVTILRAACDAVKREPPTHGGSQYHKSLVPIGPNYSFGREDYERLVPIGCRHSFWSQDDERYHEEGTPHPHPPEGTRMTSG